MRCRVPRTRRGPGPGRRDGRCPAPVSVCMTGGSCWAKSATSCSAWPKCGDTAATASATREGSVPDLRRAQPPVAEVIDITTGVLGGRKLLLAVQVYETVEPESLMEVTARFPWSGLVTDGIN